MKKPRSIILYIAASLDGYIADEHGGVGWLDEMSAQGDNGYSVFLRTVDTLIMGRTTYDQVLTFGPWPYAGKKVYVFSRSRTGSDGRVEFVNGDPAKLIRRLRRSAGKGLWLVGGAETVNRFLTTGLIDEIWVHVAPVLLGNGISLFGPGRPWTKLELLGTRRFGALVKLRYRVMRPQRRNQKAFINKGNK